MKSITEQIKQKPWIGWLLFFATIVIVFMLGLLASSIVERRAEAVFAYTPQVDYPDWEPRNEKWGENFPREYQSYMKTADTGFKSKYNGSAMIDMLEEDPRLVVLWAGYPFSKDYNQGRGHYYAVTDVRNTLRIGAPAEDKPSPMPNTCWTCKSPDVPRLMSETGIAAFYKGTLDEKGHEIINPIGCADCHDAKTMNLRISRPALIEAFERTGRDITKASHQEMRSLVCAQCHVEYYFNKKKIEGVQYLTLPWDDGITADDMENYYDNIEFADWTHAMSKTPMLKAQHPDYEIFTTGIHYERGVACADCHMPYKSEGGQKFTDHHIQSPLNNVTNSCQVCHREETSKLIADVYSRQDKLIQNRDKLEELLVRAHNEAKVALELGAKEQQMKEIQKLIRHSQWRWDYVAASHGAAFHAPVESGRVLSTGIAKAGEARIQLARLLASLGHNKEIAYPDISTKAKAQAFIGLDMAMLNAEKDEFIKNIVPKWIEEGRKREQGWDK
ncbi:MAG: ammonia-forming cytochrome c nitrite reductase [Bacteroidales bacterium]